MMLQQIPIQEISTLAILLPLGWALVKFKTGGLKLRLFFVFLLLGAMIDGLGWFLYLNGFGFYFHSILQYFYLWFEALFFIWLAFEFLEFDKRAVLKKGFLVLIRLLFAVEGFTRFVLGFGTGKFTGFVYAVFLVVSAFLMAFALLRIAETREDLLTYSWFWILSGIFFYSFGTFFIDLLSYTDFGTHIWGLRNVVNIIQYGFFVVGLVRVR